MIPGKRVVRDGKREGEVNGFAVDRGGGKKNGRTERGAEDRKPRYEENQPGTASWETCVRIA